MRIGIDIGGTKAVIALVDEDARILRKERIATGASTRCGDIAVLAAKKALELVVGSSIVDFVGIGVPGTVDKTGKAVVNAPNLDWRDEPLAEYFREASGIDPYVAQDTRAAAWGEARNGRMKEKRCVMCVTLGTGIGCGIVLNGSIWHGATGTAGEIGHIPVIANGRECNCGRRGCMEAYASGSGMARTARELGVCQSTEDLFSLAEGGEVVALRIIDEAVGHAAAALVAAINILSPDAVLFSGGLSAQNALYVQPLIGQIRQMAYPGSLDEDFYIGPAFLGSDAPVIGAAFLDESL